MVFHLWIASRQPAARQRVSAASSVIIPATWKRSAPKTRNSPKALPAWTRFSVAFLLDTAGHLAGGALVPLGAAAKVATLAKDVPLGIKTLYGMGTGATIGGVQGLAGTKDLTDLPQAAKDTAIGTIVGAGVGGAIPGVAKVIGAGYEKAANAFGGRVEGMSRAAGGHLIRGVEADGPAAVQARLAELGPDATLADAGPALLGKAQGAALNWDEGRSVLQNRPDHPRQGNERPRIQATSIALWARARRSADRYGRDHGASLRRRCVNYPAALDNARRSRSHRL